MKMSFVMKDVSLKEAQSAFQKTIMWTKNRAKGGKSGKLHVVKLVYFHKN
jgi:hypothetical protein